MRCANPNCAQWENYGGRGILVCERWRDDYDAFFADMGECPKGLSLDRIDVNKGYEPGNCRWVGWDVQATNKRVNVHLTYEGRTMTQSQWAAELGISDDTLWRRLHILKMDLGRALQSGSLARVAKCGTRHGYEKGCRCGECKAAHAERHRMMRAKRKEKANV